MHNHNTMKTKILLTLSGIALLLASCIKEQVFEPVIEEDNRIPLNIDGSINQVATKATAAGFVDKDAVGLYAVNYTENNTIAGTLATKGNQADNVKYVFDEPNYKWVPVKPVYYKDINTNVDLYLYYPFQGEISNVNAANFEVKKDQSTAATATALSGYEASDWMWGKATDITPTESKVSIPLSHKLSAIQVTLNEGTGWDEGEFEAQSKGVIVTNTTRKATLNYATGEVTPVGAPQLDGIVMCPQTDGTFRAVVIPQTVAAGTSLFSITVNGISYSFTQTSSVTYLQGKQLNVSINIKKKVPTGEYELELANAQIVDWTEDLNTHGGEARQYFVVNVKTPGTLGEVILAMGKNPDKIKNLKVTGTVTEADFLFMRKEMAILEAVNMKESRVVNIGTGPEIWSYDENGEWGPWDRGEPFCDDIIPSHAFANKTSLRFFVFPEYLEGIMNEAFAYSGLSGALILPDEVVYINSYAFATTKVTSLQLPNALEIIDDCAFDGCSSLTGSLLLPDGLRTVGYNAFNSCHFSGILHLPESLELLKSGAFYNSGSYIGDLIIPERITSLPDEVFSNSTFSGSLFLNNVQSIGYACFNCCGFYGDLIIPEGITDLSNGAFAQNHFASISFPSSLRSIESNCFWLSPSICEPIVIPEGVLTIGTGAFQLCSNIPSLSLPSTLLTLQDRAFSECYSISSIICNAIEPPSVLSDAFAGVAKDNFTVEVPSQSVRRYQAEDGWGDFKRIAAHYDFSLSRKQMRALNGTISRSFVLHVPSNFSWSIQEKPDWVNIVPAYGTGKTDVTIIVSEMTAADVATFDVNEGSFNNPSHKTYNGRSGDIIFKLDDKDYTFSFTVEQYDYAHPDGFAQTLHQATIGNGIDIVLTGDGYDARDIAKGTFIDNAEEAYNHLFNVEPYKTYKDYFNVYAVTALSDESGIGTLNTIIDSKFGSTFTQNRILLEHQDEVFAFAKKADAGMDLSKSLIILLQNTSTYEGMTYLYGDGSAIACCPVSQQAYPYDFRGIVQHEAGGHGFGKLADEYIYHNAFIQNCLCTDGCDHGEVFNVMKSLGWYKNLSFSSDATQVPWAHLIYHPQYSDYVDMFEGGYMHSRGVYRSEATSCMNNNIPYFSAISRQAIVERIKYCAGETFTLAEFYANDDGSFGPKTRVRGEYVVDRTFGVDPNFHMGSGHGPVYMGEHPNVK